LLAHVLKQAGKKVVLAGNIGEPSISHLNEPDDTIFVLEMSSYQLADLEIAPDIAVMLNLFEEHMDWHGDVANYHAAKMRIAELQKAGDVLVYNEKFPQLVELAQRVKPRACPFGLTDDPLLKSLRLLGEHNRENACAVLAIAKLLQVPDLVVASAFASYKTLPHRLEVLEADGLTFVNDSISTTPQSALAAIDVFADRLGAIILGGQDRGYHFDELAQRVVTLKATVYIMPGGERIGEAIREAGGSSIGVKTLSEAVAHAKANLKPGQVCLLSPASPSYGQFKNFEERGQMFTDAVKNA
jgi:UDP-N-acetylmuramoylalanine--D-glutamate ligase